MKCRPHDAVPALAGRSRRRCLAALVLGLTAWLGTAGVAEAQIASPNVLVYGTVNLFGFGYPAGVDPTAGASTFGLAAGATSVATQSFFHVFPFRPAKGDYPNTDRIFVGSVQTGDHDGYSSYSGRKHGPMIFKLDYSALVPPGAKVATLTLGIAADDFQFPVIGNPFIATVNGQLNQALTNLLESLIESGPLTQYVSIGIDPKTLRGNKILHVAIDEGGDGGDGWAVDCLTVGVTTKP